MPYTLDEILHPGSIAVAGASTNPSAPGHWFVHHLQGYGFRGQIYPVNPNYPEILGLKAYPRLKEIPGNVDYVISCVPSGEVLNLLDDCSQKNVKGVHLYTARFSETGQKDAAELEQQILRKAQQLGIRLIGPNCMGLYYPGEGISFGYDFPTEPGTVGMASQTGGGAGYFIILAALRGVRFSKVISYGNGLDFNESDYLDYFVHDPETKIILMYLEGLKDSRRFWATLRQATAVKPVIIIKGGRSQAGMRAAASHTASLTTSADLWKVAVAQAGAIGVSSFDELADLAVSFYFLPAMPGTRVGVSGAGGGISVTAADECEEAGLEIIPLPAEIKGEIKAKGIKFWDWIGNPADVSVTHNFGLNGIDLFSMMAKSPEFDLLMYIINEDAPPRGEDMVLRRQRDIEGCIQVKNGCSKPVLMVAGEKSPGIEEHNHWRWVEMSKARTKLLSQGIPCYPTPGRAARAAKILFDYYRKKNHP